jgi:hypothetical protein
MLTVPNVGVLSSVADIRKAFALPDNAGVGMPSLQSRNEKPLAEFDERRRGRLIHFTTTAIKSLCSIVCRMDADGLMMECALKICGSATKSDDDLLRANMRLLVDALPKKSIQRDVLLAPVAKTYSNTILRDSFHMGKMKVATARKNFTVMAQGNQIQHGKRSRSFVTPISEAQSVIVCQKLPTLKAWIMSMGLEKWMEMTTTLEITMTKKWMCASSTLVTLLMRTMETKKSSL